jgi:hypothetical protein
MPATLATTVTRGENFVPVSRVSHSGEPTLLLLRFSFLLPCPIEHPLEVAEFELDAEDLVRVEGKTVTATGHSEFVAALYAREGLPVPVNLMAEVLHRQWRGSSVSGAGNGRRMSAHAR